MSWTELSREEKKTHARKLVGWVMKAQHKHGLTVRNMFGDIPTLTISAKDMSDDLDVPLGLVINFLTWMQDRDDLEWFVRVIIN